MKNKIDKKKIHQTCVQKQEDLIANFKKREFDLHNDMYNQNTTASQTEDRKAGKTNLLAAFGKELVFAQQELIILNSIEVANESTVVEIGATVVTEKLTFFIGISSENIEINGESIFGISTKAPIYANMQGLKKGDDFQFNETKYHIEDIY